MINEPVIPTVQEQAKAAASMIFNIRRRALQLGGTAEVTLTANYDLFGFMVSDAFQRPPEMSGVSWYCDRNLLPGRYELNIKITNYEPDTRGK